MNGLHLTCLDISVDLSYLLDVVCETDCKRLIKSEGPMLMLSSFDTFFSVLM